MLKFLQSSYIEFMQCVHCIYAIHTLYSHGTYIVFNMIPRHLHWKLYSFGKIHDLFSHPYLYATHRDDVH